uniref:Phosphomannomutase/phosphoglucomutase isoform X3 n=1 Tax=Rhizophora mucronata TaxID=61149 RepID=A0A2P2LUC6_RHIMU
MNISMDVIAQIASHLPYNRNGFKFFTKAGGLGKADIKDILEHAATIYNNFTSEGLMDSKRKASASAKRVDYMTMYASDLVKAVQTAAGNIGIQMPIKSVIKIKVHPNLNGFLNWHVKCSIRKIVHDTMILHEKFFKAGSIILDYMPIF